MTDLEMAVQNLAGHTLAFAAMVCAYFRKDAGLPR